MNDLLTDLARVPTPAPTVRLDSVQRRARTLRRAHRARRAVSTGAVAAALALGGVAVPQLLDPGTDGSGPSPVALAFGVAPARAADAGKHCDTGTADWVDRSAWAEAPAVTGAAHLLQDSPWPLTGLGVLADTRGCVPAAPAAVFLDTDPMRGLTVWADVADPLPAGTDGVVDVAVRGTEGRLRDLDSAAFVTWLEDGTRWMANGSGMTVTELLGFVDGLALDGRTQSVASTPEGFEAVPDTERPTSLTLQTWWVRYGDTEPTGEGEHRGVPRDAGVELSVTTGYQEPAEVVASYDAAWVRFVDVDGVRGVFAPWGDPTTDVGGRLTWQRDGVTYRLAGGVPVERLAELARTVHPVGVTDPRVVEAPAM